MAANFVRLLLQGCEPYRPQIRRGPQVRNFISLNHSILSGCLPRKCEVQLVYGSWFPKLGPPGQNLRRHCFFLVNGIKGTIYRRRSRHHNFMVTIYRNKYVVIFGTLRIDREYGKRFSAMGLSEHHLLSQFRDISSSGHAVASPSSQRGRTVAELPVPMVIWIHG